MTSPSDTTAGSDDARDAGLRYTTDADPGIRRRRQGKGFAYVGADGRPIREPRVLERVRALAVPPAWTDVWICPDALGHLQATGRDGRGRKQSRYHARWRETRDEAKFHRMVGFGRSLPALRARVARDLADVDLSRRCVVAAVVRLLDTTLIRIGNDDYAKENHSYGLTTLRAKHVDTAGRRIRLLFLGKSGKEHDVVVTDRKAARVVRGCLHLPGQRLFQWVEADGTRHGVTSDDVNAYLHEVTGEEFTAKDFRTWAGTVLAMAELGLVAPPDSETATKRTINAVVDAVAKRLRNTRPVCRRSYVHPAVLRACEERTYWQGVERLSRKAARGLRVEESLALRFLVRSERGPRRRRAA